MRILAALAALAVVSLADSAIEFQSGTTLPVGGSISGKWENPPLKFEFNRLGNMEVTEANAAVVVLGRRKLFDPKTIDITVEPPQLILTDEGYLQLLDATGLVMTEFTNATTPGTGEENGPFRGKVEFDRRFRVRNSNDDILWEFPPPRAPMTTLDSRRAHTISVGEYLVSSDNKWSLTVNTKGQLISNTGFAFNKPVGQLRDPRVVSLNHDGSLKMYDWDGKDIALSNLPGAPTPSAQYIMTISTEGNVLVQNAEGEDSWDVDIVQPLPDAGTEYLHMISYATGMCLEAKEINNKMGLYQQPCRDDAAQMWTMGGDNLLKSKLTKTCVSKDMTFEKCGATEWYRDNTQFKFDNQCITSGDEPLKDVPVTLTKCTDSLVHHWKHGKMETPATIASSLLAQVVDGLCVTVERGKVVQTKCDTKSLLWAESGGLIRYAANPLLCLSASGASVSLDRCEKASRWTADGNTLSVKAGDGCLDSQDGPTLKPCQGSRTQMYELSGQPKFVPANLKYGPLKAAHFPKMVGLVNKLPALVDDGDNTVWARDGNFFRSKDNPMMCINAASPGLTLCRSPSADWKSEDMLLRSGTSSLCLAGVSGMTVLGATACNKESPQQQFVWNAERPFPADLTYKPIVQVAKNQCVYAEGNVIKQKQCTGEDAALWGNDKGKLRLKANKVKCAGLDGANLVLQDCTSAPTWTFDEDSGTLKAGDKCVDDWGVDGRQLYVSPCFNNANQMYSIDNPMVVPSNLDFRPLRSTQTRKQACAKPSTFEVYVWEENSNPDSMFAYDNGLFRVKVNPAYCLSATEGKRGFKLFAKPCKGAVRWDKSGKQIKPRGENACMDIFGTEFKDGGIMGIWDCTGKSNQDIVHDPRAWYGNKLISGTHGDSLYDEECLWNGSKSACFKNGELWINGVRIVDDEGDSARCANAPKPRRMTMTTGGIGIFDVNNGRCHLYNSHGKVGNGQYTAEPGSDGYLRFNTDGFKWHAPK